MKSIRLGEAIQILSNIGVLAGIVFLAYEIHQNTVSTQLSAAQNYLGSSYQMSMHFAENPELAGLVTKSMTNPDQLSPIEAFQLDRLQFSTLRTWQNMHYQYITHVLGEDFWLPQRRFIKSTLNANGSLRAYWKANAHFYTSAFNEEVQKIVQELKVD